MKYWRAPNDGPCLVIQDQVLEIFMKYAQTSLFMPESGGILATLGSRILKFWERLNRLVGINA